MLGIVIRVVLIALALIAAVYLVPGARFEGQWWQLLAVAAIFGLINAYLRPIVKFLSLPLNLIGFGLVGLIINTSLLLLVALASGQLDLGFSLAGWPATEFDLDVAVAAFLTSLVVSAVSAVLAVARLFVPGM
ncbi:MAG: phage holin family protein [Chloroflexota bacterium]|nr:phage holin family protein [Chloroflexota bacterium]